MARRPGNALTLVQQAGWLRAQYPEAASPRVNGVRLTWLYCAQPTPCSVTYTVRVELHHTDGLSVTVVDPALELADGQTHLPHVYPGNRLCLYYDEFNREVDLLAIKVVPWISEWLYFYELWLTTGEWHGGGVHPGETAESPQSRRHRRWHAQHPEKRRRVPTLTPAPRPRL